MFQKQIKEGIIEEVKLDGIVGGATYLSHIEVIKNESTATKGRIVFDSTDSNKKKDLSISTSITWDFCGLKIFLVMKNVEYVNIDLLCNIWGHMFPALIECYRGKSYLEI